MNIIFKIIGSVLICVSSAMMGIHLSKKEGLRINDLTELKKAILILKAEIEFASNALPEALENVDGRCDVSFFRSVAERIKRRSGEELYGIWDEEIGRNFKNSYLAGEDLAALSRLGKTLGYMDKSLQSGNIEMGVNYIDDKIAELRVVSEKNKRLYRSLGILFGLLITVIAL